MDVRQKQACIVGGGLVGSLCACYLAKRNYDVELYELRDDFRGNQSVKGRSINMALSERGLQALAKVGLRDSVTSFGIPMHARMIHGLDGSTRAIPYGKTGQFIYSIDRMKMNEIILTAAIDQFGVKAYFGQKMESCDPTTGQISFKKQQTNEKVSKTFDLIVGCDGAFSSVRRALSRHCKFNFEQKYIEHGYMEIEFPPNANGRHQMPANYLHIWPRNEFMLIGLPNLDGSFTGTAFMPFSIFEQFHSEQAVLKFFRETFPDAVQFVGEDNLVQTIMQLKPLPLLSIRCHPYHVADKTVIIGDAAHAMVPFYGQGMNCGFEDCIILDSLLQQYNDDLGTALAAFTETRMEDAHAIVDLALYNYIEMRQSVNSIWFLMRKRLDNILHWLFPDKWVPLYTMVTFSRTRYSEAIISRNWQDQQLSRLLLLTGCCAAGGCMWLGVRSGLLAAASRQLKLSWSGLIG